MSLLSWDESANYNGKLVKDSWTAKNPPKISQQIWANISYRYHATFPQQGYLICWMSGTVIKSAN